MTGSTPFPDGLGGAGLCHRYFVFRSHEIIHAQILLRCVDSVHSLLFSVYFAYPSEQGLLWHLLGHISNAKPSAIFKIANLKPSKATFGIRLITRTILI